MTLALALLGAGVVHLSGVSLGHGGEGWRGPGDTVPPGAIPPPYTAPPTTPAVPGSTGSSPSGSGTPSVPTGGFTGGGRGGGLGPGGGAGGRAATGLLLELESLDLWQYWWEFNRDPFLKLKTKVFAARSSYGSDDFFLGRAHREQPRNSFRPSREEIERTIVPALLAVLRTEKSREPTNSAMIALAKIGGDDSFVDAIVPFLRDGNQTVVETATVALGILARPKALSLLEGLARDGPEGRRRVGRGEVPFRVRTFATYGLALLAAGRPESRSAAAEILVDLLESDRSIFKDVRVATAIGLGLFVDPEGRTLPALERVLEDRTVDTVVRAHVPVSIAKALRLGDFPASAAGRATELFLRALSGGEKDERVRGSCVIALGLLASRSRPGNERVVRALARAVHDAPRDQERNFAAIALAEAGGSEASSALLRAVARGRTTIRPWAGLALGVLCFRARDAGHALPERGAILQRLREAVLEEGNPEFAAAYAIALGLAADPAGFRPVAGRMMEIADEPSRGAFCVALGLLGDPSVRPFLREEMRRSLTKPDLLSQAAIGLGLLSDVEAVPELLRLLRESRALYVQAAVSMALGFIGDSRSIPDLLDLLEDHGQTDLARGFAAVALGMIGDKEELPWNSKIAVSTNYRAIVRTLVGSALAPGILDIL